MEGQDPREAVLLDKGDDRLVEEALHHAQLQPHTQQPASDQRRVLLGVLCADRHLDEGLAEAVEAVGGWADGLKRARVELRRRQQLRRRCCPRQLRARGSEDGSREDWEGSWGGLGAANRLGIQAERVSKRGRCNRRPPPRGSRREGRERRECG